MRSIQQTKDAETLFFLEQPQALELVVPGDGEAFPLGFTRLTDYPEAPASAASSHKEHEWSKHKGEMKDEMISSGRPEAQK